MYIFVDFIVFILVSYIVMITRLVGVLVINSCMFGRALLSDETLHVMICVMWFNVNICVFCEGDNWRVGGGLKYSGNLRPMFSLVCSREVVINHP